MQYLSIEELRQSLKTMLTLEIIVQPKQWLRLIRFYEKDGCLKFWIDNEDGNSLTVMILGNNTLIKGFAPKNELNQYDAEEWDPNFTQRMFEGLPDGLSHALSEDERDETTFCIWHTGQDASWTQHEVAGNDGGKERLLRYICSTPEMWSDWASDCYQLSPNMDAVRQVYSGKAVTPELILSLNPDRDVEEAQQEIEALAALDEFESFYI